MVSTQYLNVLRVFRGTTLRVRDDVIEMKSGSRFTLHATSPIALPYFELYPAWCKSAVRGVLMHKLWFVGGFDEIVLLFLFLVAARFLLNSPQCLKYATVRFPTFRAAPVRASEFPKAF